MIRPNQRIDRIVSKRRSQICASVEQTKKTSNVSTLYVHTFIHHYKKNIDSILQFYFGQWLIRYILEVEMITSMKLRLGAVALHPPCKSRHARLLYRIITTPNNELKLQTVHMLHVSKTNCI